MQQRLESWTGLATQQVVPVLHMSSRDDDPFSQCHRILLPRGYGCSYGDVCLPTDAAVDCTGLNRILWFDPASGIIRAEAGVRLGDLVAYTIPHGWILPVLPGISSVSIGGAVANDIHGKSHHWAGTLGRWVRRFELLRSDGPIECSPDENADFFRATIGGLGLTGIIRWVEFQLVPCHSPWMECHDVRFTSLDEYAAVTRELERTFEYVVAWCDLSQRGTIAGIIHAARFCTDSRNQRIRRDNRNVLKHFPRLPLPLVSRTTIWLAARLRFALHSFRPNRIAHYHTVLFPFDGLPWNRLFGRRGFYQLHAVLPVAERSSAIWKLCQQLWRSRIAVPLCVLKNFSALPSPGLLSFPIEGTSIAIDVPNVAAARHVLHKLSSEITACGGRIYPAKDALLSAEQFQRMYPNWQQLEHFRDKRCCSQFWQRVTAC